MWIRTTSAEVLNADYLSSIFTVGAAECSIVATDYRRCTVVLLYAVAGDIYKRDWIFEQILQALASGEQELLDILQLAEDFDDLVAERTDKA